ncbi:MAG: lipocalin family protein [Trueperaceae bacterium]|nr:lipocalin family protein [Trueperaceae bacterium]
MRAVLVIAIALTLASCGPDVYEQPLAVRPITLPRDDAAHLAPIEWWYYTGHLVTDDDHEYGFELTFFQAYTPPDIRILGLLPARWLIPRGYVGHAALLDKTGESFHGFERSSLWGYRATASRNRLDIYVGNWTARRAPDGVSHHITFDTEAGKLALTLTPTKPVALHGNPPGIQTLGPGGVSYYLSYTRMSASGALRTDSGVQRVTGQAWHDHQWGDFDISRFAGWDWFSLQLDDGRDLMLYLIREPSGTYTIGEGSLIDADGTLTPLDADDFVLTVTDTWQSPDTGARYPIAWTLALPTYGLDLSVTPVIPNQEMDTRASTGIVYWEGAVAVGGSHDGVGFVELTNYDRYPYGQTDTKTPLQPLAGPLSVF